MKAIVLSLMFCAVSASAEGPWPESKVVDSTSPPTAAQLAHLPPAKSRIARQPQPESRVVEITFDQKPMIAIYEDGRVIFAPEYTPNSMAKLFWASVMNNNPFTHVYNRLVITNLRLVKEVKRMNTEIRALYAANKTLANFAKDKEVASDDDAESR